MPETDNPTNPTNPMNPMNSPTPTPLPVECVGVIGLGYVGLSLATAFGRVLPTIGFDIDHSRIQELKSSHDRTGEIPSEALKLPQLVLTHDPALLERADFLIVTVPTPVDRAKRPDLSYLVKASRLIGHILKDRRPTADHGPETGDRRPETEIPALRTQHPTRKTRHPIIVYESTVYPGCTEEVCIPVLEQESGLKVGKDFRVGYSPERINPGDPEHTLETIAKVVAAQDGETVETMMKVYGLVVKAGVYKAPDIRTAEAAKVIENIQRDLNIALMNELAMLFHRLGVDTREVLKAARTKWNFLPFEPGLVGGHCIPVDPYYLTHKAQEIGYHPEVILAGRRINDSMGVYVAHETVRLLIKAGKVVRGAKILVLGATFKENVRDIRNTRVVDIVEELKSYGCEVSVYDPLVNPADLQNLGFRTVPDPFQRTELSKVNEINTTDEHDRPQHDALILAVPHRIFCEKQPEAYTSLLKGRDETGVLVDVKGALHFAKNRDAGNPRVLYWALYGRGWSDANLSR
jgi:UDP-N-acetyl-D-galactosamine dehydrogenase